MLEVNVDKQAHRNIFQLKHTGLFPSPETVDTTSPAVIFGIFEISYVSDLFGKCPNSFQLFLNYNHFFLSLLSNNTSI